MFKQLRKANQNDYLLITATLILLVVFNLSLLSYVQGQQKAAERGQALALATGFSRTLKGKINLLTDPIRGPLCRYEISRQVTVTQGPIADCLADMEKYVFPEVSKD